MLSFLLMSGFLLVPPIKKCLAEFGAIGALIAGYLIFRQLGMVFGWSDNIVYILTAVSTIGYLSLLQIPWSSPAHFHVRHYDPIGHHRTRHRWCDLWFNGRTHESSWLQWLVGTHLHIRYHDGSCAFGSLDPLLKSLDL